MLRVAAQMNKTCKTGYLDVFCDYFMNQRLQVYST